jgi:transposase InsO family protein
MLRTSLTSVVKVSRAAQYYQPIQPKKDEALKQKIEEVLREHPAYGHRRLALALKRNKKAIKRVMKIYGIIPYRKSRKKWRKPRKASGSYPNLLHTTVPAYLHHVWVADFTHVVWRGRNVYIATVMDVFTRQIVGVSVLMTHRAILVVEALRRALTRHQRPVIFHSDNGSEYDAEEFIKVLVENRIAISRSAPGCPWENGFQESFYGKFKTDLGDPNRFESLGELVAEVYRTVHIYNTTRIHLALKMSPAQFAELHRGVIMKTAVDSVS